MVRTNVPDSVKKSWPAPNFINPQTQGPALNILSTILLILVLGIVGLRLYVRKQILHAFRTDDWLIALCLLPAIALNVAAFVSTYYGWGVHYWDQRPEWYVPSEPLSWTVQVLYIFNMFFAKTSILFGYLRFIRRKSTRIFIWIMIGTMIAWFNGSLWTTIFACYPPSRYWYSLSTEHCNNEGLRVAICSTIEIVTDFIVLAIPVHTIWNLRIAVREKVVLVCLLSFGLIASLTSLARLVLLIAEVNSWDDTWWGYPTLILTCVEVDLALICPSIPPLRPLLRLCTESLQRVVSKNRKSSDTVHIIDKSDSTEDRLVHADRPNMPPANASYSLEDRQLRASENIIDGKGVIAALRRNDDNV